MQSSPLSQFRHYLLRFSVRLIAVLFLILAGATRSEAREIVFVMDSSNSIGADGWTGTKNFFSRIVSQISPSDYLGLVQFSTSSTIKYTFNLNQQRATIQNAINNLAFLGQETYTKDALDDAIQIFDTTTKNTGIRIIVLATDSAPTIAAQNITAAQITALKQKGIVVLVYGMGPSFPAGTFNPFTYHGGAVYSPRALLSSTNGVAAADQFLTDASLYFNSTIPTVTTEAPELLTPGFAKLKGTINRGGIPTVANFYIDTSYIDSVPVPAGTTPFPVELTVGGYIPGSGHTVKVTVDNPAATGAAVPFNFSGGAPTITTLPPSNIRATRASLQASVNPNLVPTGIEFYLNNILVATLSSGTGTSATTFTFEATGLIEGTNYTLRTRAFSPNFSVEGGQFTFTAAEPAASFTQSAASGGVVPESGTDIRIQAGGKWRGFGPPAINDANQVAYLGRWYSPAGGGLPKQSGAGIFLDDTLVVKIGEDVPGITGAKFTVLKDPVIDQAGHVAFIANITSANAAVVSPSNDTVIVSDAGGEGLEVIAREGSEAPGASGATYRFFSNVAINAGTVLFTGGLNKGTGEPATTASSDLGAWWLPAGGSDVIKVVREGDDGFLENETIRTFQVLRNFSGTGAHTRGQRIGATALLQVVTSTGRQSQVLAGSGTLTEIVTSGDTLNGTSMPSAKWSKMNLASSGGQNVSTLGKIVGSTLSGIFSSSDFGSNWEPVARPGDTAPGFGSGDTIKALRDPVNAPDGGALAFLGVAAGSSITTANNDALWFRPEGGDLALVAREGDPAAEAPVGAKWKSFSSVTIPGLGQGPIFTAYLQRGIGSDPGPGGITAADDMGLYRVDSTGTVHELLRENGFILGKRVKSFNVLRSVKGSQGTGRSTNRAGSVAIQVRYADYSTAIVVMTLNG